MKPGSVPLVVSSPPELSTSNQTVVPSDAVSVTIVTESWSSSVPTLLPGVESGSWRSALTTCAVLVIDPAWSRITDSCRLAELPLPRVAGRVHSPLTESYEPSTDRVPL